MQIEARYNASYAPAVQMRYVDTFIDRNGGRRYYFRRGKGARWVLPGGPGSPEFKAAYAWALHANRQQFEEQRRRRRLTGTQRTFLMLARAYYASRAFRRLSASAQQMHERAIDRLLLRTTIGLWAVENVNRCQVERIMERLAETPAVANDALRKQRLLMGLAIAKKWRVDDPTSGIAFYELGTVRAWTDAEVATYRARWPRGTPQRTAFALFLFTRHRCTGVAAMSWVELDSLAATDLEAELCSVPRIGAHVLVTQRGEPYSAKGLGNFMAAAIRQAGLPPTCVPDGLRTTLALHAMKKPEGLPVGALQDPRWQTAKHEIAPNG